MTSLWSASACSWGEHVSCTLSWCRSSQTYRLIPSIISDLHSVACWHWGHQSCRLFTTDKNHFLFCDCCCILFLISVSILDFSAVRTPKILFLEVIPSRTTTSSRSFCSSSRTEAMDGLGRYPELHRKQERKCRSRWGCYVHSVSVFYFYI